MYGIAFKVVVTMEIRSNGTSNNGTDREKASRSSQTFRTLAAKADPAGALAGRRL